MNRSRAVLGDHVAAQCRKYRLESPLCRTCGSNAVSQFRKSLRFTWLIEKATLTTANREGNKHSQKPETRRNTRITQTYIGRSLHSRILKIEHQKIHHRFGSQACHSCQ